MASKFRNDDYPRAPHEDEEMGGLERVALPVAHYNAKTIKRTGGSLAKRPFLDSKSAIKAKRDHLTGLDKALQAGEAFRAAAWEIGEVRPYIETLDAMLAKLQERRGELK